MRSCNIISYEELILAWEAKYRKTYETEKIWMDGYISPEHLSLYLLVQPNWVRFHVNKLYTDEEYYERWKYLQLVIR